MSLAPVSIWAVLSRYLATIAVAIALLRVHSADAEVSQSCALPPAGPDAQKYYAALIAMYGGRPYEDAPVVRPVSRSSEFVLTVRYADNSVEGCPVHLRSYNGHLVGDTIRAKPGDTLFIRLENHLPMASNAPPGGHEAHGGTGEFSFNITNLHTHGLHTSPSGQGDNVLVEVAPGKSREYLIKIPANHPAGLFWYHAHFHGSTAVQLSSGMAGALVIEGGSDARGGLDSIPEIKAAKEHILVLQQLRYGPDGQLEEFDTPFGKGQWTRGITVNGLFVPTISMRPGEVQRWRIVHAGVADNINLSLDGHKLNEIATDGIALGRLVSWPGATPTNPTNSLVLGPGYRTDVLVQAAPLQNGETSHEYYLRDGPLPPHLSLQSAFEAFSEARQSQADVNTLAVRNAMGSIPGKPSRVIARIVVQGSPLQMALPSSAALADRVPTSLRPIQDGDITGTAQTVSLQVDQRRCAADGSCEADACTKDSAGCMERYMVNNRLFNMGHTRTLKLGQAAEWKLQSLDVFAHPFHIHVNPFQLTRLEPDATGKMVSGVVWKDTVSLPTDQSVLTVRTRYADFTGRFVLHCHILPHEDMGMMELVEIVP